MARSAPAWLTRGEPPPTVADALTRLVRATEDLLAALDRSAKHATSDDGWRAADHAFHVATWDCGCVALLSGTQRWDAIGVNEDVWRGGDINRINAAIFAANRDRPASDAIAELTMSRAALHQAVATIENDDLLAPYGAFQPGERPLNFDPVYGWVEENGWIHPAEHAAAVAALGGSRR